MKHRSVGNVMTQDVVSVRVRTPFRSIAELLSTHHISAVPVLGATDTVLGVVSEVDLLRKYELSVAVDRPPWWARTRRRMWLKATGTVAEDVMTTPAITVDVDANIGVAARLLTDHNVKRLPVVDASDHLVGIVSRHDLVQVFVRSDDDIHAEIGEEVLVRALSVDPRTVSIEVRDGAVTLRGQLERRSMVPMAIHLTRSVDGVVAVTRSTHLHDGRHACQRWHPAAEPQDPASYAARALTRANPVGSQVRRRLGNRSVVHGGQIDAAGSIC